MKDRKAQRCYRYLFFNENPNKFIACIKQFQLVWVVIDLCHSHPADHNSAIWRGLLRVENDKNRVYNANLCLSQVLQGWLRSPHSELSAEIGDRLMEQIKPEHRREQSTKSHQSQQDTMNRTGTKHAFITGHVKYWNFIVCARCWTVKTIQHLIYKYTFFLLEYKENKKKICTLSAICFRNGSHHLCSLNR